MPDNMKVCVVGLGKVGLPTAQYISNRKIEVFGYDINPEAVEKAEKLGLEASSNIDTLPYADVYIICVSTTVNKNGKPNLSQIFDASEKVSKRSNRNTLLSIESTVLPGTSRKIFHSIFKDDVKLIHVPHRYWSEDPVRYGVKQLRVIGGINRESLREGLKFYGEMLDIPLHEVSLIEVAEMCKIVENAYRYMQIAFAEELKMICEDLKLPFEDVRKACNTKWNVEILEARNGITDSCLPKDIKYLSSLSSHNLLLKAALEVDRQYREWKNAVMNLRET
jgi:nucleotide sugar dehydrogenase